MKLTIKPIDAKKLDALLNRNREAAKKALKATISDVRKGVPGKVADEVSSVYNINKGQVMPKKGKPRKGRAAGSIRIKGETLEDLNVVYTGHKLSPARFGMTPKKPPKVKYRKGKRIARPVKAQILKGHKTTIHSEAFIGKTGTYGTDADGNAKYDYIPFKRKGKKRYPIEAIKTVSLPGMVGSPRVRPNINKNVQALIKSNLERNIRRFFQK